MTWSGHGDALALWRIESAGSLTLANSFAYSTWGTPTTATHNGYGDLGFRFLYVGAHGVAWDNALGLGLLYMSARHYGPVLGRFLQPDPSAAEVNLYAYTGNSPVTMVDPSGLAGECVAVPHPGLRFGCELGYAGWALAGVALGIIAGALATSSVKVSTKTWREPYTDCFVIGEVQARVNRFAAQKRCSTMPRFEPGVAKNLIRPFKLIYNMEWMLMQMSQRKRLYDIGPEFLVSLGRSPYYRMEYSLSLGYPFTTRIWGWH